MVRTMSGRFPLNPRLINGTRTSHINPGKSHLAHHIGFSGSPLGAPRVNLQQGANVTHFLSMCPVNYDISTLLIEYAAKINVVILK